MNKLNSTTTTTSSPNRHLVESLQEERCELWSLYCQIAEMKPSFNSTKIRPVLSKFSQLLIDYVSLGHFGIYEHLLTEKQQTSSVISYANKIYPVFSNTTESAITFSDEYDETKRNFKTDNLAQDLSALGEQLAKRMELEDQLCSMLLH